MNYYTLNIQPQPIFPQVQCLSQEDARRLRPGKFPDFTPKLTFSFTKGAKPTDILSQASISAQGILINEKTKYLLLNFKLIEHSIFVANVVRSEIKYYWMHFIDSLERINWLDYSNSTFYTTEFGFREDNIELKSYDDFKRKSKEISDMGTIEIEKIRLNSQFNYNTDLFIIPNLTKDIFISARLKEALELSKITGIIIEDAHIS